MAVRIFALALVIAQVMACGEAVVNCDFEHGLLSGRAQGWTALNGELSIVTRVARRSSGAGQHRRAVELRSTGQPRAAVPTCAFIPISQGVTRLCGGSSVR